MLVSFSLTLNNRNSVHEVTQLVTCTELLCKQVSAQGKCTNMQTMYCCGIEESHQSTDVGLHQQTNYDHY